METNQAPPREQVFTIRELEQGTTLLARAKQPPWHTENERFNEPDYQAIVGSGSVVCRDVDRGDAEAIAWAMTHLPALLTLARQALTPAEDPRVGVPSSATQAPAPPPAAGSEIRFVQQEHPMGCARACLAMIMGITYDQAGQYFGDVDWYATGVYQMTDVIADVGAALQQRHRLPRHVAGGPERKDWPPAPWTGTHLCHVNVSEQSPHHFVVMDASGEVFDPALGRGRKLTDYWRVNWVAGVYLALG